MDQSLKGDAGQCQETTKVQGEKKNGSFGILCFYSSCGLVKGVWITSNGILNKAMAELCPRPSSLWAKESHAVKTATQQLKPAPVTVK